MPWQTIRLWLRARRRVSLQGRNLTDQLAYARTSFIKMAAPLMGRNVAVGVKVTF